MNNVYLIPNNDGTYWSYIGSTAPSDKAVILTAEGEYPVLYYYRKLDTNGSSVYDAIECTNREQLIDALNHSGGAFYTVRSIWDFDSDKTECSAVQEIFSSATEVAMEQSALEMAGIAVFDYFAKVWKPEDVWEECENDNGSVGYCSTKFINEAVDLIVDFASKEGYLIDIGDTEIGLVDQAHPEKGLVASNLAEVVQMIREWDYTLMNAGSEDEESRYLFLQNAITIEKFAEKVNSRSVYNIDNKRYS